ncbi:hypothetical protein GCM10027081_17120 [Cupriavidus yeoncheonensis]
MLALWTSATMTALSVSVVINQAAATSFIHIVMFAPSQASQRLRNTGPSRGINAAGSLISLALAW